MIHDAKIRFSIKITIKCPKFLKNFGHYETDSIKLLEIIINRLQQRVNYYKSSIAEERTASVFILP